MTKDLTWYNTFQYISMLLVAVAIPIGFHQALWMSGLLALSSLVAMAARRRVGNPAMKGGLRWGLVFLAGYWLLLLVSMLYTADTATGWDVLWHKAMLLVFSLSFLLADTSWLTPRTMRGVGYAFLASMTGVFLYLAGVAVGKMIGGSTLGAVTGSTFDPIRPSTSPPPWLSSTMNSMPIGAS